MYFITIIVSFHDFILNVDVDCCWNAVDEIKHPLFNLFVYEFLNSKQYRY